jgi:RNA polymerase sigma factor (sigma-70 family)
MALVQGLKARNPTAQETFWKRYWDVAYPISAHILGVCPDAVDVAVDLLVDFMERRVHRLSAHQALFAYVRLAAVRRAIRYRNKRNSSALYDERSFEDLNLNTPEDHAALSTLMPRLDECLKSITPKAQETLRLKFVADFTNEHIGRLIGGSKQYIGRLIQKSLEALKRCIEKTTEQGDP